MRSVNSEGISIIKKWEGWSSKVYLCPANRFTIGYGSCWDIKGAPVGADHPDITREEGEALLRREISHVEKAVGRLIKAELTDNMFSSLCSWTYNLGSGALQRSTLRQCILRGQYEEAGDQYLRWVYAGGRRLMGLVKRRQEERLLFLS